MSPSAHHRARESLTRLVGALSRRLDRPEWLAAVDAAARNSQLAAATTRAVVAATLRHDSSYVDVGTNRGQILRDVLRVAPEGHHLAFEPIPELARRIREVWPQVDCRTVALGARPGHAEFCHYTALDGWSGLRHRPQVSDERGRPVAISVDVSTLDAEAAAIDPALVKIDVEGGETHVLRGGVRLLERVRPIVIFEHEADAAALYDTAPDEPWAFLNDLGYRVYTILGEGPFSREEFMRATPTVDWLAAPR